MKRILELVAAVEPKSVLYNIRSKDQETDWFKRKKLRRKETDQSSCVQRPIAIRWRRPRCLYVNVEETTPMRSADGTAHGDYVFNICMNRVGSHAVSRILTYQEQQIMVGGCFAGHVSK